MVTNKKKGGEIMTKQEAYKKQMNAEDMSRIKALVQAMTVQRKALGMSQRELAECCDMPQSSIARIETFKTTPNLRTVLRMMHYLGMEMTVNVKQTELIKAEAKLVKEIEAGFKSGEETGWYSQEEIEEHFRKRGSEI